MKKNTVILIASFVTLVTFTGTSHGARPVEGELKPFLGAPRMEMEQVFQGQRFPNVVVTMDGTILASFGSSEVMVRRSTDGGATWGPPIAIAKPGFQGGGMTVDETNGDILAFVEEKHPPAPLAVYRSSDDGNYKSLAVIKWK